MQLKRNKITMYLGYSSSVTSEDTSECLRHLNSKPLWRKTSCTLFQCKIVPIICQHFSVTEDLFCLLHA